MMPQQEEPEPKLLRTCCPFSEHEARAKLPFKLEDASYLEITGDEEPLFSYVSKFLSTKVDSRSISVDMVAHARGRRSSLDDWEDMMMGKGKGKGKLCGGPERGRRKHEVQLPTAEIGLGWHDFDFEYEDEQKEQTSSKFVALLQRLGEPWGSRFFESLVIFVEGTNKFPLLKLCQCATDEATKQKQNRVSLWRFDMGRKFWTRGSERLARSLDSVVIDDKLKAPLLEDVEWFLKDATRGFYAKHGIPYHRCYLFHGEPGTGKTSFIYALAGHLERNLAFIQMDKSMTDGTFREAMSSSMLPKSPMVVLEDVDSLFTNHREANHATSSLSFSGFLNCLDGLGAPEDVVVCMTTNHPERLDPAVMRPGRIDLKVEFKKPNKDVAARYFLTFYPEAVEQAARFGAAVGSRVQERKVSMAQLQHFFLACHRQDMNAEAAADYIKEFTFEESIGQTSNWTNSYG